MRPESQERLLARLDAVGMAMDAYLKRLGYDFEFFTQELWHDRNLNRVAPLGWVERDICQFIQHGPKRQVVLANRGFGKTHLTAVRVVWEGYRNADAKIAIVSKSEGQAVKTIHLIRQWIDQVPFLQHLHPNASKRARGAKKARDSTLCFDFGPAREDRTPSVYAAGIGGQLEGNRAHVLIADDIETTENTKTPQSREDLDNRVKEFGDITSYGERRIIYVGTYHHEDSLYLKLDKRGYTIRTWPLLYPAKDDLIIGLAPAVAQRLASGESQPGDIVADYRFDLEYVAEKQSEGRHRFAMQHMLIADLGDAQRYPLRLSDLIVFTVQRDQAPIRIAWGTHHGAGTSTRLDDIPSYGISSNDALHAPIMFDERWAPYTGTKAFLDPAGRGADESALCIGGQLHGFIFAKCLWATEESISEPHNILKLVRLLRFHRCQELMIETNFGGDALPRLIQPVLRRHFVEPGATDESGEQHPDGWGCTIVEKRQTAAGGFKEERVINALEPVTSTHRLVIDRSIAADEKFQKQYTRIMRVRNCLDHDDRVEAVAGMVDMWNLELEVDPEDAAKHQHEQWLEEQRRMFDAWAGANTTEPRWFEHY